MKNALVKHSKLYIVQCSSVGYKRLKVNLRDAL